MTLNTSNFSNYVRHKKIMNFKQSYALQHVLQTYLSQGVWEAITSLIAHWFFITRPAIILQQGEKISEKKSLSIRQTCISTRSAFITVSLKCHFNWLSRF